MISLHHDITIKFPKESKRLAASSRVKKTTFTFGFLDLAVMHVIARKGQGAIAPDFLLAPTHLIIYMIIFDFICDLYHRMSQVGYISKTFRLASLAALFYTLLSK